uniref:Uncharacterized protein n=1 Tax=Ralstonia solanacearum TaxID=305 RepID=A0A0S4X1H7_RALSL|nr:protein of unknown function [Ralstonia solanacearum]
MMYFVPGACVRTPACKPPDEYGGSVKNRSTDASGRSRNTSRALLRCRWLSCAAARAFVVMGGVSTVRSSAALWCGALGPQNVHGPATRAFDGKAHVFTCAEFAVARTATDVLHEWLFLLC